MCSERSSNAGGWVWGDQDVFEEITSNQIIAGKVALRESEQECFPPYPQT
jgi:hypothetical protein